MVVSPPYEIGGKPNVERQGGASPRGKTPLSRLREPSPLFLRGDTAESPMSSAQHPQLPLALWERVGVRESQTAFSYFQRTETQRIEIWLCVVLRGYSLTSAPLTPSPEASARKPGGRGDIRPAKAQAAVFPNQTRAPSRSPRSNAAPASPQPKNILNQAIIRDSPGSPQGGRTFLADLKFIPRFSLDSEKRFVYCIQNLHAGIFLLTSYNPCVNESPSLGAGSFVPSNKVQRNRVGYSAREGLGAGGQQAPGFSP
jgi:hypothetical protein